MPTAQKNAYIAEHGATIIDLVDSFEPVARCRMNKKELARFERAQGLLLQAYHFAPHEPTMLWVPTQFYAAGASMLHMMRGYNFPALTLEKFLNKIV